MTANATYHFEGKTILITGGAGDIGKATAHRFAANGAGVALLDLDAAKTSGIVQELKKYPVPLGGFYCDVTDAESVAQAFSDAIKQFGQIDYVFNNAGYQGMFAKTDDYPADDFHKVININVIGVFHVLQTAARHLRDSQRSASPSGSTGCIVNMASHAGVDGPPNMLAYAASKFAVIGMTQTAAKDLAPYGIRVNSLSPSLIGPGVMWTRQTELQAAVGSQYFDAEPKVVEQQMIDSVPLRRLGTLAEVANGVAFLMSDEASYITGFNLDITGGQ